jgi:hypothetical protein
MPLNKGYPIKNTIVKPKVNHHTLHSPSCGFSIEGFMLTKIDLKLGFEKTDVSNLPPLVEFVLHNIKGTRTENPFSGWHATIPLTT